MLLSRTQLPPRRSFLLAAGTAAGVTALNACSGGGGETGSAPVEYQQGTASLKVELGPEIEGVPYPEGYVGPKARESEPFSDGSHVFDMLARSETELDLETNVHSLFLEEKTGVKVSYSTVPQGNEGAPKVNAIIASGDLPDAFLLGPEWMGGFSKSELYVYGEQGLFQPLDQLVDEYAPQLLEIFDQNPDMRAEWTAPNGAMYAIPQLNQCYHCASSEVRTWVHRPLLEAIGYSEAPGTLDEFEEMLREFKKYDPTIQPMSGFMDRLPFGLIGAAFLDIGIGHVRRDGESIVFTPMDDQFREVLKVVNRFVADGLIDPNSFTQNQDQLMRLTMDEAGARVGVVQALHHHEFVDIEYENPDARYLEYEPLAPFAGPLGDPIIPWNESHGGAVGLVISNACEDPATLVRWADFQLGLLSTLEMHHGQQGVHWEWALGGETGIDGRPALYRNIPQEGEEEANLTWPEFAPQNSGMDVRHGQAANEATSIEPILHDAGKLYEPYRNKPEAVFSDPFYDSVQAAEVGEIRTNLETAYAQGTAQMSLGELDPNDDADWEAYLSAFTNAGVDRYLEILAEVDQNRA